jgi:murein L,D-transpeptidase YcbB/YkuD
VEWDVKRNKIKLHKALMTLLGERKSKYPYAEFQPLHKEYAYLKKALARYREIQKNGGWPAIPANTKLKPGQSSPVVPLLQKRLADLIGKSDSTTSGGDSSVYSSHIVNAVKKFQQLHGQKPDGNIGPETVKLLNVPIQNRIRQIIINMERWRWIPKSFEPSYLLVNIPEFKLHVVEKSKEVMTMNVIVGKEMHETPIFSDKLEHVVISPYWNIPPNILKDEIVPRVMSDPGYLDRMNIEVVTNKGTPVDPASVDWSQAGSEGFGYVVRKKPGPKNDLGDVKFIFPNVDNIYLHDTPHDELFSQSKRGFSHGCVRVERPIELATYLLRNVPGWDRGNIMRQVSTRKERYVPVKEKLPVYLVYFTAKADANGNVQFYEDIYDHDAELASLYFSKL